MLNAKPWYLSKTIWASLVSILLALAGLLGAPVAAIDSGQAVDAILQAASAIAGLVAIFGRLMASERIS
ncbi:MAG: hypothetical protein WAT70_12735 [Rhizobiaceae bacterium]